MNDIEKLVAYKDRLLVSGPEHFDVSALLKVDGREVTMDETNGFMSIVQGTYPIGDNYTMCFIGHKYMIGGVYSLPWFDKNARLIVNTEHWHLVSFDNWNMRTAYDTYLLEGYNDQEAQWHCALELVDRVIKGMENG